MQTVMKTVKCCGNVYSIEAWRLAYEYIVNHKLPDKKFEREMEKLGVSRPNAYALYRTQLYKPQEIRFSKTKKTKSRLRISVKVAEKIPVPKARKP